MIYIDGKEINWGWLAMTESNALRKFTAPHTWTIAPHLIKFDFANGRYQCPNYQVPSKYSSRFRYGAENTTPKAMHTVEYSTGSQPHPTRQGVMLNIPAGIMITGGYEEDVIDNEINFFHYYAPWTQDGIAYDKRQEKKIYLFSAAKVAGKAESEAEIKMRILTKVINLKGKDIVAMARLISSLPGVRMGVSVNDGVLESENLDMINTHLISLKNGIFKFAETNPHQLKNLLTQKQADVFSVFENAREAEVIRLETDKMTPPVQGVWKLIKKDGTEEDICTVQDNERPIDAITNFMAKPKSEVIFECIRNRTEEVIKSKELESSK